MTRKGHGFELEIGQPRCEEPYYGSNVCMSVLKLKIIAVQGPLTVQNVFFMEMRLVATFRERSVQMQMVLSQSGRSIQSKWTNFRLLEPPRAVHFRQDRF